MLVYMVARVSLKESLKVHVKECGQVEPFKIHVWFVEGHDHQKFHFYRSKTENGSIYSIFPHICTCTLAFFFSHFYFCTLLASAVTYEFITQKRKFVIKKPKIFLWGCSGSTVLNSLISCNSKRDQADLSQKRFVYYNVFSHWNVIASIFNKK